MIGAVRRDREVAGRREAPPSSRRTWWLNLVCLSRLRRPAPSPTMLQGRPPDAPIHIRAARAPMAPSPASPCTTHTHPNNCLMVTDDADPASPPELSNPHPFFQTNNPRKINVLTQLGIKVTGRIPCLVEAGKYNQVGRRGGGGGAARQVRPLVGGTSPAVAPSPEVQATGRGSCSQPWSLKQRPGSPEATGFGNPVG